MPTFRHSEKGAFARGAFRKFVADCTPNLHKSACVSFRTSEEGCANLSQTCRILAINFGQFYAEIPLLGVAKGSSVQWVPKFKGDKNSECELSSGRSRSYMVIKDDSFCREMSGREVTGR